MSLSPSLLVLLALPLIAWAVHPRCYERVAPSSHACTAKRLRYKFENMACRKFLGCPGGRNNFETIMECARNCVESKRRKRSMMADMGSIFESNANATAGCFEGKADGFTNQNNTGCPTRLDRIDTVMANIMVRHFAH